MTWPQTDRLPAVTTLDRGVHEKVDRLAKFLGVPRAEALRRIAGELFRSDEDQEVAPMRKAALEMMVVKGEK